MKSNLKEANQTSELTFPCLLRYTNEHTDVDIILLATSANNNRQNPTLIGTVVWDNTNYWGVGEFSDNWSLKDFKVFKGSVELSGEDL